MSDLPTAEEAFPLPTAAEAFPDSLEPVPILGRKPLHEYFQSGFTRGFGEAYPSTKEIGDILSKSGLIGDIENHQQSVVQEFNETILYGPVLAIDLAARSFMGLVAGVSDVAIGTGVPREFTPGAALEAFPFGVRGLTGVPRRPAINLDAAAELGLVGRPVEIARQAFAPSTELRALEPEALAPVRPPSIHETARVIAPEAFGRYDDLVSTRQVLRDWLDEFEGQRVNIGGVEVPREAPLLETARQFERLGEQVTADVAGREIPLNARLLETARRIEEEGPVVERVRADLARIDREIIEAAPEVTRAYREARDIEGTPPQVVPQPVSEANTPALRALAQRAQAIGRDIEQRLVEVGRPRDEARASGAIVQAHYETRAARFNGALGTARELYERERPEITTGVGGARGGITLGARNVINLMRRGDASTFMHETAHDWLEEIRRDAGHEAAPADLRADWDSVRTWLGAEGATLNRRQHEKFARGFERYLMEGQAPSARLASVFEKFREWLTKIYRTVSNLRAPITDEIRGVYDRLLALPNSDPVITAERPGALNFAEEHALAARETPLAEALAKADEMRRQRDIVGAAVSEAVDNARREARRGPERVNLPERSGERGDAARREGEIGPDVEISDGRKGTTGTIETAPDGSFGPGQSELFDYKAGNIRTENLTQIDDVRAAIKEAAGTEGGFLHARRGQLSDVETVQLADALGDSASLIDRWKVGQAFNAEEVIWARKLLVKSAEDLVNAAGKAVDEKGVISYALARERHMMIQEVVSGVTAEAGRALRAFRQLDELTDPALIKTFLQSTTRLTPQQLMQEAARVRNAPNSRAVNVQMSKARKATWSDMALEGYINALLSGPYTHLVNTVSNALTNFSSLPETALAAAISKLRKDEAISFAEVGDRFWGVGEGAVDGIRAAGEIVRDEGRIPVEGRTMDTFVRQAIPSKTVMIAGVPFRLGGNQVRLPGRLLAAEDEFFKAIAFQQEINVLSRRTARQEGLAGEAFAARIVELKQNPTDAMVAAAKQHAEYQTFTNELGRTGQAMLSFVNSHPAIKVFIPFLRTPINLLKYSAERTPLGLASREVRARLTSDNPVIRDTQLARMALGSMVMVGAGWLTIQGLISDGGPKSSGEIETKRNTGWLPYAFRIGDLWYSYRRFDPLSNIIGLAADLTKIGQYLNHDDVEFNKAAGMVMLATWRNLGDKLALRGVSGAFQAVTAWEQHGRSFVNGLVSSVVPAAVGQFAQMEDPVMREARTMVDAVKNRVPYEREELLPRLDRWGQPLLQTDIGPIQARAVNNDPVNLALADLEINKAQPQRKVNGVELTSQQYHDYVAISGQMAKRILDGIVTPQFRQLPKLVQVETIEKVIDQTREMGRAYVTAQSVGGENDLIQKGMDQIMQKLH